MTSSLHQHYATLGLSPNANAQEIKQAFKEMAFQYHPDRNQSPWAEDKFKSVVEAYSYLSGNLELLQALRQAPAAASSPRPSGAAAESEDLLKILLDIDSAPVSQRVRVLEAELSLSLEQAFHGGSFPLSVQRHDLCRSCQGSGVEPGAKVFTCTYCFGEGRVASAAQGERECPKCNGRGFLSARACLHCRARGVFLKEAKLKVEVPPKSTPGQSLLIARAGHELKAGFRSEVRVKISLQKHATFSFDGSDVICETAIGMSDAALGSELTVPSLDGPQRLTLPPTTQSGDVIRLKGLGLGGDQLVRIWVKTPQVRREKERRLLEDFKAAQTNARQGFWARAKKWIW